MAQNQYNLNTIRTKEAKMKKGIIYRIRAIKKSTKLHLIIVSFIIVMTAIFTSFLALVPKDYKGEENTTFLATPLSKTIKMEQKSTGE